jgi:hypothetical protein
MKPQKLSQLDASKMHKLSHHGTALRPLLPARRGKLAALPGLVGRACLG